MRLTLQSSLFLPRLSCFFLNKYSWILARLWFISSILTMLTLTVFVSIVIASMEERIFPCPYSSVPGGISLLVVNGVLTRDLNPGVMRNQ